MRNTVPFVSAYFRKYSSVVLSCRTPYTTDAIERPNPRSVGFRCSPVYLRNRVTELRDESGVARIDYPIMQMRSLKSSDWRKMASVQERQETTVLLSIDFIVRKAP